MLKTRFIIINITKFATSLWYEGNNVRLYRYTSDQNIAKKYSINRNVFVIWSCASIKNESRTIYQMQKDSSCEIRRRSVSENIKI